MNSPAKLRWGHCEFSSTNLKNSLPAIFIPWPPILSLHDDIWSKIIHCKFSFRNFSIYFVERIATKNMIRISVLKIRSIQILNRIGRKSPILLIIGPAWSSMWFKTYSRSFSDVFTGPISCFVTNVFTINILSKYMNGACHIFFDRIKFDFETSEIRSREFCFSVGNFSDFYSKQTGLLAWWYFHIIMFVSNRPTTIVKPIPFETLRFGFSYDLRLLGTHKIPWDYLKNKMTDGIESETVQQHAQMVYRYLPQISADK